MYCLLSGRPDTLIARARPAAAVTSVKTTDVCAARATILRAPRAAVPSPPRVRRNARRGIPHQRCFVSVSSSALLTPRSRCSSLLLELVVLAFELLENLQRLTAFVHQAETPADACEHVIVGGRARVQHDRLVQCSRRLVEFALPLEGARLLKQCAVGFRIEHQRGARVLQRLLRIARPV